MLSTSCYLCDFCLWYMVRKASSIWTYEKVFLGLSYTFMTVFLTLNMSGIYSCLRFEWLIQLFVPKCLLNCPHWSLWIISSFPPTELRCILYHKLNSHIYLDIFLNLHFSSYDWSLYLCTSTTLFGLPQW